MSQRTTDALVIECLIGDYDSENNPSLARCIKWATLLTDRVSTCATDKDWTLSSDELEEIETNLAAHKYCLTDRTYRSRNTLSAGGAFDGNTAMGLDATMYGQAAKMLDTSGCLSAFDKGQRGGMEWMGLPVNEQTTYWDRN